MDSGLINYHCLALTLAGCLSVTGCVSQPSLFPMRGVASCVVVRSGELESQAIKRLLTESAETGYMVVNGREITLQLDNGIVQSNDRMRNYSVSKFDPQKMNQIVRVGENLCVQEL